MVKEKFRNNTYWNEYVGKRAKIVFQDGHNKDGTEHISLKEGIIEKVTKTHLILKDDDRGKTNAINLHRIIRAEW